MIDILLDGRRESERAAQAVPAVSQPAHGPRRATRSSTSARRRCCAPRAAPTSPRSSGSSRAGALLDLPQRDGITPLMAAVGPGASPIDTRGKFRTALEALETADALLDAGARSINARDARGRTALHAAARGLHRSRELLRRTGADLDRRRRGRRHVLDAALGKLRGRGGRNAIGEVHEDTAALIRELAGGPTPQ